MKKHMENTNITKKYTAISQAILVGAILFASPAFALADTFVTDPVIEGGFITDPVIEGGFGSDPVIEGGFIMDPVIEGGFNTSPVPNTTTVTPARTIPVPSFVSVTSGSFFGGGSGAVSSGYSQVSASTPSSGGFSGGSSNLTPSNFALASTQGINSGSFSGGFIPSNNFLPVTQTYFPNNQVLALNNTPNLSSVYLSDVPYTGAGDIARISLFALSLILWSILLTYAILRKKVISQELLAVENVLMTDTTAGVLDQIDSDRKDIESIESYARENKVLLSTDASAKLLKLERLNQINAKDLINQISTEDWICVGERDLEKQL